jgi:hypothetical protein
MQRAVFEALTIFLTYIRRLVDRQELEPPANQALKLSCAANQRPLCKGKWMYYSQSKKLNCRLVADGSCHNMPPLSQS